MTPPVRITAAGELPLTSYDYVNAPYEVAFIVAIETPPAVKRWSRKRRIRWRRQYLRRIVNAQKKVAQGAADRMCKYILETALIPRPPDKEFVLPILFKRADYRGETDFSCCGGFDKHLAWCNYAPGN